VAVALFDRACEDDQLDGCLELALAAEAGRGMPQDFVRAGDLYRDICEEDVAVACARLANLHDLGAGVFRDAELATRLRRKACNLGQRESCAKPAGAPVPVSTVAPGAAT
jgi:TPR repeat protein